MCNVVRRSWFALAFALTFALTLIVSGDLIVATENRSEVSGQVGVTTAAVPSVEPQLTPASCTGSLVVLTPSIPAPNFTSDAGIHERGIFITATENFDVCNIAFKLDLVALPQTLTARIYAANGNTRGALVASGSVSASSNAHVLHFVPIDYTLQACQDYEITMTVPASTHFEWWDENLIAMPFDRGGVIRVREASSDGSPVNFALTHFELIGQATPEATTDLAASGPYTNSSTNQTQERGVFIKALDTARVQSFGWQADLDAGGVLVARVYEANGTVRGALIAAGTYTVPSAGMQWHDVPVSAQLVEGKDYDIAIQFGLTNLWNYWSEGVIPTPYERGIYRVVTSEIGGDPSNTALPHYRVGWAAKVGGAPFDLAKPSGPNPAPNVSSQDNSTYGAYITSVIDQQAYSLGWEANIPPGQLVTARVYAATGVVRGALISEGTAYSGAAGMRWHDVPVAVELKAGEDYDIAIVWANVTSWRWWDDTAGLPYTAYGTIAVNTGESGGEEDNFALIRMRVFACSENLTPIAKEDPARTPMFLATPAPNPVSTMSRLDFALEEDGPVSIAVYNVAGQRVTTLLDGQRPKGWHSLDFDSGNLASGVYFLKMQTKVKSVSRKFVVTH